MGSGVTEFWHPKIAISHWLAASPLQQCGTTVRHCDNEVLAALKWGIITLSVLATVFRGGPGLAGTRMFPFWILLEPRMTHVVVTTGAIIRATSCIARVQSSRSTNQHQAFYRPDVLPVARPNQQCRSTEWKDFNTCIADRNYLGRLDDRNVCFRTHCPRHSDSTQSR